MIKEKKKNKEKKKTIGQIIVEYLRTIFIALSVAAFITILISLHARSEMIKNLHEMKNSHMIDEKLAKKLIQETDLTKALVTKNYLICMQVGSLYESARDYKNAEFAYKLAIQKAPANNYTAYYRLAQIYVKQDKFKETYELIKSTKDFQDKYLIKFKTRTYIDIGDRYYSKGEFILAARSYEKAKYYYDKFAKQDKVVKESIMIRIYKAYEKAADVTVKNGNNSDAVKLLKRAIDYKPEDLYLQYKLAIIYTDLDPETAVSMFEKLNTKIPQYIDYNIYNRALMKAANIADLDGKKTLAQYYRYKIHSKDLFINKKVIYKDDVEIELEDFSVRKVFFNYRYSSKFKIINVSSVDIYELYADIILKDDDEVMDKITIQCVDKKHPLYSNGGETNDISFKLGKNIYSRKELKQYSMEIYLYKDEKYKTLIAKYKYSNEPKQKNFVKYTDYVNQRGL